MKRLIETKFWTFNQNNSGGYFVSDDNFGVGETVIIEATSSNEAWERLKEIGDNVNGFWEFCGCCGERWSNWMDETDGTENPMIYGEPVEDVKIGLFRSKSFVHYLDGTFKKFDHKL